MKHIQILFAVSIVAGGLSSPSFAVQNAPKSYFELWNRSHDTYYFIIDSDVYALESGNRFELQDVTDFALSTLPEPDSADQVFSFIVYDNNHAVSLLELVNVGRVVRLQPQKGEFKFGVGNMSASGYKLRGNLSLKNMAMYPNPEYVFERTLFSNIQKLDDKYHTMAKQKLGVVLPEWESSEMLEAEKQMEAYDIGWLKQEIRKDSDNVNRPLAFGWYPLHHAVHLESPQIVALLLQMGAETNVKNALGQTPLDLAKVMLSRYKEGKKDLEAIISLLKK